MAQSDIILSESLTEHIGNGIDEFSHIRLLFVCFAGVPALNVHEGSRKFFTMIQEIMGRLFPPLSCKIGVITQDQNKGGAVMSEHRSRQIIDLLSNARVKRGMSQTRVADHIGVSRKTVQNWENGLGAPDIDQVKDWCEAIGENPMIIFTLFIFGEASGTNLKRKDAKRTTVADYIMARMSDQEIDILFFLITGVSGSSPYPYLQKIGADLSCPISDRVNSAKLIQSSYEMASKTHMTTPYAPDIDCEALEWAVKLGKEAAISNRRNLLKNRNEA